MEQQVAGVYPGENKNRHSDGYRRGTLLRRVLVVANAQATERIGLHGGRRYR